MAHSKQHKAEVDKASATLREFTNTAPTLSRNAQWQIKTDSQTIDKTDAKKKHHKTDSVGQGAIVRKQTQQRENEKPAKVDLVVIYTTRGSENTAKRKQTVKSGLDYGQPIKRL